MTKRKKKSSPIVVLMSIHKEIWNDNIVFMLSDVAIAHTVKNTQTALKIIVH